MKKLISIFSVLIVVFTLSFVSVQASQKEAYNIITNPGENMQTTMHVNYHSDVEGTFVELTKFEDATYENKKVFYPETVSWERTEGADTKGWESTGFYKRFVNRVVLDNLEPNTKYRYRVGKTSFSEDYFFTTAGTDAFSFVHITDPQYYSSDTSQIFNNLLTKVLEVEPDVSFGLFTGDVVDRGGRAAQWDLLFEKSNIRQMPFAMTPGNHEYYDNSASPKTTSNDYFINHYFNPQNGPSTVTNSLVGSSYYFKYNNVLFISIDTESQVPVPQAAWFKEVVEKEQAQYIIVGMHRSFYGSQYESHSTQVRNAWQKTFEEYGVDLVLSGHDHVYARSHLMYQNQVTEDYTKGITYIIGGSGGSKFYSVRESAMKYYAKAIENTTVANIITVSEENISLKLIDLDGKVLDSHIILPKRPASISEEFSKEDFLNNVLAIQSPENIRELSLMWPDTAYGHVDKIHLNVGRLNYETYISSPHRKSLDVTLTIGKVYDLIVTITFKDGDEQILEIPVTTKLPFGSITHLGSKDITNKSAIIYWEAELENKQVASYNILIDGELYKTVDKDEVSVTIDNLSKGTEYEVVFQVIDIYDDVVFEEKISFVTTSSGCNSLALLIFTLPLFGAGFIVIRKKREEE